MYNRFNKTESFSASHYHKEEKEMKKAVISLVLLLAAGALLFAGGQSSPAPAPTPAGAAEKTPIEQYNSGYAFPTEKIELAYWHVLGTRPGFDELAKEIAAEYTAIHPNVAQKLRNVVRPKAVANPSAPCSANHSAVRGCPITT